MQPGFQPTSRQRGAALAIGLLLLVALTLLALAGLRSAATALIMSGNQQYSSNSFQAAETGIEIVYNSGAFNPGVPADVLEGNVPGSATDTYRVTTTPALNGDPQSALWGNSWNAFATYHFAIQSVGASARGTSATNTQGIAVLAPFGSSVSGSGELN